MTEGLSRTPDMPYHIKEQPTLTFVARQEGEAWNRPFVAVYEPSSVKEPGNIVSVTFPEVQSEEKGSHIGICINQKMDVWTYSVFGQSVGYMSIRTDECIGFLCIMGRKRRKRLYGFLGWRYFFTNTSDYDKICYTGQCIVGIKTG